MQSVATYLNMGGYAGFVWTAWGLTILVLGGLVWFSLRELRTREAEIAALEASAPHRRARTGGGGS